MTTRKEIIIKKYLEFQEKIKLFDINENIFPSLEEMDVVDILIYFSTKSFSILYSFDFKKILYLIQIINFCLNQIIYFFIKIVC